MSGRVNAALTGMSEEDREHWSNRVHYIAMDANFWMLVLQISLRLKNRLPGCIDRLQRWKRWEASGILILIKILVGTVSILLQMNQFTSILNLV